MALLLHAVFCVLHTLYVGIHIRGKLLDLLLHCLMGGHVMCRGGRSNRPTSAAIGAGAGRERRRAGSLRWLRPAATPGVRAGCRADFGAP